MFTIYYRHNFIRINVNLLVINLLIIDYSYIIKYVEFLCFFLKTLTVIIILYIPININQYN